VTELAIQRPVHNTIRAFYTAVTKSCFSLINRSFLLLPNLLIHLRPKSQKHFPPTTRYSEKSAICIFVVIRTFLTLPNWECHHLFSLTSALSYFHLVIAEWACLIYIDANSTHVDPCNFGSLKSHQNLIHQRFFCL